MSHCVRTKSVRKSAYECIYVRVHICTNTMEGFESFRSRIAYMRCAHRVFILFAAGLTLGSELAYEHRKRKHDGESGFAIGHDMCVFCAYDKYVCNMDDVLDLVRRRTTTRGFGKCSRED